MFSIPASPGSYDESFVPASRDATLTAHSLRRTQLRADIQHKAIQSAKLPKPAGPYSPAVTLDRLVFVSGQGAKDPATGQLVGTDIESQTDRVLKNIAAILEAAGSSLDHVLRCGVFLTDISDFAGMNAAYARAFRTNRPARTTVQVTALPTPGLLVEIDAIAYIP
ncbi:MAG: Rid family detoxifying hydrolase [Acidobacteriia bacterium]|nr:Rid family detoxifying hydrolase [Terriglobia bacterium]